MQTLTPDKPAPTTRNFRWFDMDKDSKNSLINPKRKGGQGQKCLHKRQIIVRFSIFKLFVQFILMESQHEIDRHNLQNWNLVRDNPTSVLESSLALLERAKEIKYTKGIAWAEGNIGAAHIWTSNYEEALEYTARAREGAHKARDFEHEVDLLYNMCVIFYFLGDYKKQIQLGRDALEVSRDHKYFRGQASAFNAIGLAHHMMGRYDEAIKYYERGVEVTEKTDAISMYLKLLEGLGQSYRKLEEYDTSLMYISKCINLSEINEKKDTESYAFDCMGSVYIQLGDTFNALINLKKALAIREDLNFKPGIAETNFHIAEAYVLEKKYDEAKEHLNRTIELAQELETYDRLAQAYLLLSDIAEALGNLEEHIQFYKAYHNAKDQHSEETASQRAKTYELSGRLAQMEKENKRLKKYYDNVEIINKIGRDITSSLTIDEINEVVYTNLSKFMKINVFGIGIADHRTNIISFPGYVEEGIRCESTSVNLDEERLASVCFHKGVDIFINDVEEEYVQFLSKFPEALSGLASQSLIYVPLKIKDKKLGVVTIQYFEKHAYSKYHLNILKNLANFISVALENARLYENMEEEVKERTKELETNYKNIELLNKIGQELISTLDFENVIERLYFNVNKLMDASIFGVRLYDEENQSIDYKYDYEGGERHKEIVVSMDDDNNYSVWCIKNNKEIFINNNRLEYTKYVEEVKVVAGDYPQSLIFYPLRRNGKPFGLITVQSLEENAYTKYHLNILKTLAHYTGIGLNNARHYEIMEAEVEKRTKELNTANIIIRRKNKDITDSINYAKRIQSALLPDDWSIKNTFDSYFHLFKPKDIVSGDFYWFYDFGDVAVCAVGDCTGHGVPGALMSVICVSQINKHVKSDDVKSPEQALRLINDGIVDTLSQQVVNTNSYDGMDIALCAYDKKRQVLNYAGAYRPLIIVRDKELLEFAPNRFSLGGEINESREYKGHEIKLEPDDKIYMFSDGYADQFGGPRNKKYLSKRLKQLFVEISDKPFDDQREILENNYIEWRRDNEQVDDILVMGIGVK